MKIYEFIPSILGDVLIRKLERANEVPVEINFV